MGLPPRKPPPPPRRGGAGLPLHPGGDPPGRRRGSPGGRAGRRRALRAPPAPEPGGQLREPALRGAGFRVLPGDAPPAPAGRSSRAGSPRRARGGIGPRPLHAGHGFQVDRGDGAGGLAPAPGHGAGRPAAERRVPVAVAPRPGRPDRAGGRAARARRAPGRGGARRRGLLRPRDLPRELLPHPVAGGGHLSPAARLASRPERRLVLPLVEEPRRPWRSPLGRVPGVPAGGRPGPLVAVQEGGRPPVGGREGGGVRGGVVLPRPRPDLQLPPHRRRPRRAPCLPGLLGDLPRRGAGREAPHRTDRPVPAQPRRRGGRGRRLVGPGGGAPSAERGLGGGPRLLERRGEEGSHQASAAPRPRGGEGRARRPRGGGRGIHGRHRPRPAGGHRAPRGAPPQPGRGAHPAGTIDGGAGSAPASRGDRSWGDPAGRESGARALDHRRPRWGRAAGPQRPRAGA